MNRYIMIRRLRMPLFVVLTGINALLNEAGILGWGKSWPLYLILAGVLSLAERMAIAADGGYPNAPYPNAPYPNAPYTGSPYSGTPNPASNAGYQPFGGTPAPEVTTASPSYEWQDAKKDEAKKDEGGSL